MNMLDRVDIEEVVRDILGRYNVMQSAALGSVQLFSPGGGIPHVANWGQSPINWPGAGNGSNPSTVQHGLPGTPTAVQVTVGTVAVDPGLVAIPHISNLTNQSFQVGFYDPVTQPAAGSFGSFLWFAVL